MDFNPEKELTTPQGHVLPDAFFSNALDRDARASILYLQKNMSLDRDNPFFGSQPPSLNTHVMGVMDRLLSWPALQEALNAGPGHPSYDFASRLGQTSLVHRDGMTLATVLGYPIKSKKWYKDFAELFNLPEFETETAMDTYRYAMTHAAQRKIPDFIKQYSLMQNSFVRDVARLEKAKSVHANAYYKLVVDAQDSLKVFENIFDISGAEAEELHDMQMRYFVLHASTTRNAMRKRSDTGMMAAHLHRQNHPLIDHARLVYAQGQGHSLPLEMENPVPHKNHILFVENFLHPLTEMSMKKPGMTRYMPLIRNGTYDYMRDYALLSTPFCHLQNGPEMTQITDRRQWLQDIYARNKEDHANRRRDTHPLADTVLMSREEIAAKAETLKHFKDYTSHSILDNAQPFPGDFIDEFNYYLQHFRNDPGYTRHKDFTL